MDRYGTGHHSVADVWFHGGGVFRNLEAYDALVRTLASLGAGYVLAVAPGPPMHSRFPFAAIFAAL